MRIVSNPTRCILFFDAKFDEKSFKIELEQFIPSGEVGIKVTSEDGAEITDQNLLSLIRSYMVQKYIITYDDSDEKGNPPYYTSTETPLDSPI